MKTTMAARSYPAYDPVHLAGTVAGRQEDGSFAVECDGRRWLARQAASCLLTPQVGDHVLISGPDPSRVYLIAVIEQADASVSRLETAGDMVIRSRGGNVSVESPRELNLQGRQALRVETASLALRAEDARCVAERMQYVGAEVKATVGTTRLIGKAYEAILDRLSFLSRLSFRATDEVEHVRAGTLDYQAEQTARVHAAYTMVTGKELVKVDAKQIHMG